MLSMKTIGKLFLIAIALILVPTVAQAAIVPCGQTTDDKCTFNDLITLVVNIFEFLLGLAALVAVIIIIWSGIRMLLYSFSEQPEAELEGAKNTLRRAVFGLVLILGAFLIVQTLLIFLGSDIEITNLKDALKPKTN